MSSINQKNNTTKNATDVPLIITPTFVDDEENSLTLKNAVCNRIFLRASFIVFPMAFALELADIVVPIYGAKYFNTNDDNSTSTCDSDAIGRYTLWAGLSNGASGFLAFLFQGYVGKLADIYGRKRLLIVTWVITFLTYSIPLTFFYQNYFPVVFITTPLASMMLGGFGGIPTILQASLADVVPSKHRTTMYALVFGMAGVSVVS